MKILYPTIWKTSHTKRRKGRDRKTASNLREAHRKKVKQEDRKLGSHRMFSESNYPEEFRDWREVCKKRLATGC